MNEGIEISTDLAHGDSSVIVEQVTNGVAVRMALLYRLAISPVAINPVAISQEEPRPYRPAIS